jgi:uncharacterized metal-binding protein
MEITTSSKTKEELINEYNDLEGEDRKILENSYITVSETNAQADRLEEIKKFAKEMGYKKIGVAFCKGLRKYGEEVDKILSEEFEVVSVCCNVRGITKQDLKVKPILNGTEPACNPIGQSTVLNDADVDIVVKCGFCLGHDLIFSKNIKAPATTLLVKDRKNKHDTTKLFNN